MIQAIQCGNTTVNLEIDDQKLSATLHLPAGASPAAGALASALGDLKLKAIDQQALDSLIRAPAGRQRSGVIANGTPPVNHRPIRLEPRTPFCDVATGLSARVETGQALATIVPASPGTNGIDLFGNPIPAEQPSTSYRLGRNVYEEAGQILASTRGNVRLTNNVLSVEPLLEMHGDDDGGSSVIVFDGDVVIRGTLRDGRTLSTAGLLIVGGAIEAAQVNVNSDAFIKGGIVGKSRGKVAIDGTLRCRFVSAGHIIGAADVIVQSEIAYSSITSAGQVSVLHGPIVGGETIANAGIVCQALGNPSGKLTIVEAGTEQSFINFVASARDEIDRNRARVADVRTKIEPLMKHVKMLTPQQKERATELLYEAGELEARTETMVTTLETRCQAFRQRSNPVIVAHETIYPGVTIRFAGMEARITTAVKGPVKLKPIKTGNITEIAMVDMVDGSTCVLQSNRPAVTVA